MLLKFRIWYARAVLAVAALLFAFLAHLYVMTPLDGIDMFGVSLSGEPHSVTFLRTGLGAMFASLFLTSVVGLIRPRLLLTCLTFVVGVMSLIVAIRVYGLAVDGVSDKNLSELTTEATCWLVFVTGWLCLPKGGVKVGGAELSTGN
jgi:hypothetical protein